jgi:c-di-GMP-binding flagellar brake protein YcgR
MNEVDMNERRKLERFELAGPARILLRVGKSRSEISLTTRDVSSGGAFLFSSHAIPTGTDIKMEFMLALELSNKLIGEESRARVRVKGKIIRSDPTGIAVRFESNYKITSLGLTRWDGMQPRLG